MCLGSTRMPTCPLCEQDRKLCDSHIIPEFLYTPTYEADGRAYEVSALGKKGRFVQKGRTEKLLCAACEKYLNDGFEDYFSKLWYSPGVLPREARSSNIHLSGLDYTRFKLFHLSILWRASVARSVTFEQTRLGPFESAIRHMLLAMDPGDALTYQIFATAMVTGNSALINHAMVMLPLPFRAHRVNAYIAIYGGCFWEIVVSRRPVRGPFEARILQEDGSLTLGVDDMLKFAPLRRHYALFTKAARKGRWKLPWAGA